MPLIPSEPPEKTFMTDVQPPFDAYMEDPGSEWKAKSAAYVSAIF